MTSIDEADLLRASGLFDGQYYLRRYPNVAASGGDPFDHYLLHGIAEGTDPNPLFSTSWYLATYPHVRTSGLVPLAHYLLHGAGQGHDPHPFFSTSAHRARFPEMAGSGLTELGHYLARVLPLDPSGFPLFGPYDVQRAIDAADAAHVEPELVRHVGVMRFRPSFLILSEDRRAGDDQIYPPALVSGDRDALYAAAETAPHPYMLWLQPGDRLHPHALYHLAAALNRDDGAGLLYFDEDVALQNELYTPVHKPAWSPDLLEVRNYLGSGACIAWQDAKPHLAVATGPYDLMLRATEWGGPAVHIERVLLTSDGSHVNDIEADMAALKGRLARTERHGHVVASASKGSYLLTAELRRQPLVSLVIPTAAKVIDYDGRKVDLIAECLDTVIRRSTYSNVEFVIVDNGDLDGERLTPFANERIIRSTWTSPEVNIARKINQGAALASGDAIVILNDDVQPVAPDWIEQMLAHLEKPHVGAVGAKLLYPKDRTIQHAGIVMCDGLPEHVRRYAPRDDRGYLESSSATRNYLAVTGAVAMVSASNFRSVGGYSEDLPIDYNDVDFSFKLVKRGLSIVYEPRAELMHFESISIVKPPRPQDAALFSQRWASIPTDPFYNQYCFSVHPATFEPAYSRRRN